MKKTTGFVIGKFMPLHKGHVYLIEFAKNLVDELTVLVDNLPDSVETMSLEERYNIVKEAFPEVNVKKIDEVTYQEPEDAEDFWEFWRDTIIRNIGYKPDYIIGSMDYIKKLAEVIGCEYIMNDKEREHLPISATMIRDALKKYDLGEIEPIKELYKFIPPETASYLSRDVYFVGGESTGKSLNSKMVSKILKTTCVPEYATYYIKENGKELNKKDFLNIVLAQIASQKTLRKESFIYLIHDTDVITTKIWYRKFFGEEGIEIFDRYIEKQKDGLYILLGNQIEWEDDSHRYFPDKEDRVWFFEQFIVELNNYHKRYVIVDDPATDILGIIKSHI